MDVTGHYSVEAFFHEVVVDALKSQHVAASPHTECYLVSLLGEFARIQISDEPLSLKLVGTQGADPAVRVKTLKEVGDTSLYVTGFFAESLSRRLVDADYYIGLGATAYSELAQRLGGGGSGMGEVYGELAGNFPRFVDVLGEVRERVDLVGSDVVKLYEQWKKSRSAWMERRLRAMGMLVDGEGTKH